MAHVGIASQKGLIGITIVVKLMLFHWLKIHISSLVVDVTLYQSYSEFPHKNRACHGQSTCIATVFICILDIASAPTVTGSVFMRRICFFLAQCGEKIHFTMFLMLNILHIFYFSIFIFLYYPIANSIIQLHYFSGKRKHSAQ